MVIDQNNVIDFNLIKIKTELKEQSPKKLKTNMPLMKGFKKAIANNNLNSNKFDEVGDLDILEEQIED